MSRALCRAGRIPGLTFLEHLLSPCYDNSTKPRLIGDAERGLVLDAGAASKRRATSSGLRTTGSLRGSWTNVRCRAASARPSVTVKKNRNAETRIGRSRERIQRDFERRLGRRPQWTQGLESHRGAWPLPAKPGELRLHEPAWMGRVRHQHDKKGKYKSDCKNFSRKISARVFLFHRRQYLASNRIRYDHRPEMLDEFQLPTGRHAPIAPLLRKPRP